jgi:hypothetical protein
LRDPKFRVMICYRLSSRAYKAIRQDPKTIFLNTFAENFYLSLKVS